MKVNKIQFILASTKDKNKLVKELNDLLIVHDINETDLDKLWKELSVPSKFDSKEVVYIKRVLQRTIPEKISNMSIGMYIFFMI